MLMPDGRLRDLGVCRGIGTGGWVERTGKIRLRDCGSLLLIGTWEYISDLSSRCMFT